MIFRENKLKKETKEKLKIFLPSKVISFFRKLKFNRSSKQKKIFHDGTIYYGVQEEDYELNILSLLKNFSSKYDSFVNFGANTGYFPIRLAKNFNTIIAVEALRENFNILQKNIRENSFTKKIIGLNLAVSDHTKSINFYGNSSGGSAIKGWNNQVNKNQKVKAVTGDSLYHQYLNDKKGSLFLIDCEASEFEVLLGLKKTVRITDSTFIVEIPCREFMPKDIFNPRFQDIFNFMFQYGYKAQVINGNGSLKNLSKEMIARFVKENRFEGMMVLFKKR